MGGDGFAPPHHLEGSLSIFDRFRGKPDPLLVKARELVDTAHLAARTSLTLILKKVESPALRRVVTSEGGNESWNLFMTAACVHVALVELTGRVSGDRFDTLAAIPFSPIPASPDSSGSWSKEGGVAAQELNQFQQGWIKNGEAAVVDCAKFVGVPEGGLGAIGVWVLWSVYNRPPPDDERELISAIGQVALDFCTYWE